MRTLIEGGEPLAAPEAQSDWAADVGTRVYWLALLVGLIVGGLGTGFHLMVDALVQARTVLVAGGYDQFLPLRQLVAFAGAAIARLDLGPYVPWGLPADPLVSARFAITAAVIALALCVSRWLVRRVAPETSGSGVQEIEGTLLGMRDLRWRRVLPVKFLGGGLALGAGLVLGREGPTIHMGGAAALGVARAARSRPGEVTALIAAGAGAGLAAAFNAPIAGVLFVIEEMRREAPYNFQGYHAVLIACVAAVFVTEAISGVGPELRLPMAAPLLAHYPLFLAMGIILGVLGAVFNRLVLVTLRGLLGVVDACRLVAGAGLVAGDGRSVVPAARWRRCRGADHPAAGGPIARDSGTAGAAAGPARGHARELRRWYAGRRVRTHTGARHHCRAGLRRGGRSPNAGPEPGTGGLRRGGMAALFTGSVRAPLVGVVLVAELTDGYPALLAITLSTAMASLAAAAVGGRPLYELLLERTLRLSRPPTKLMEPA